MKIIMLFGYLLLLIRIFLEDFKEREVRVLWFILMLAFILIIFPVNVLTLKQALMNVTLLCLELFITAAYFRFVRGNRGSFFDGVIGWGDILMLVLFCLCYSFTNYVLFIFSAFLVTLFSHILFKRIFSSYKSNVPLAGIMALYHGVLLLAVVLPGQSPAINFSDILTFQT